MPTCDRPRYKAPHNGGRDGRSSLIGRLRPRLACFTATEIAWLASIDLFFTRFANFSAAPPRRPPPQHNEKQDLDVIFGSITFTCAHHPDKALTRHISEQCSRDKSGPPYSGVSQCSIAADPTGSGRCAVDRREIIYSPQCSPGVPRHHRQTYRTSDSLHTPAPCPLHASHGLPWPIGVFARRAAL